MRSAINLLDKKNLEIRSKVFKNDMIMLHSSIN